MSRGVIQRNLRDRRIALAVYCLAALAFALMYTSLFPSLKGQMDSYGEIIKSFPKGMLEAMGIDQLNIGNYESYFSAEYFSLIWPILAIIFAISQAGRALAGGIEFGSIGLELAQPVSRLNLYFSKYLAGALMLLAFSLVTVLGVLPIAWLFDATVTVTNWLKLAGIAWLFVMTVYSLAYAVGAATSDRARAYGIVAGTLLVMYVGRVIASLQERVDWLRLGSFFYYFDGPNILNKGTIMLNSVAVFVIVSFLSVALGAWWWQRRDISV